VVLNEISTGTTLPFTFNNNNNNNNSNTTTTTTTNNNNNNNNNNIINNNNNNSLWGVIRKRFNVLHPCTTGYGRRPIGSDTTQGNV
jgi:hypothetical protein